MKKIKVGRTEIEVSRLGLGTVKFGRNQGVKYPEAFILPSEKEMRALLDLAKELGINLLDTAPAYGESEERLGKLLRGERDQWVLATKAGEEFINGESHYDFSAEHICFSVDRSLQRLQTDYLDVLLIHSNGEDKKIIEEDDVFHTLNTLKQAGKIRAFGMSTKTVAGGLLAVAHADVVMVTYNPLQLEEKPVIASAYQKQVAVFIKKAFASGHLDKLASHGLDPILTAMQCIFQEPGVTSVILGTLNLQHLSHNVSAARLALTT